MSQIHRIALRWETGLARSVIQNDFLESYSICRAHGRPMILQLWFQGQNGIEISSEPMEVNERTEAGVLIVQDAKLRDCDQTELSPEHWLAQSRLVEVLVHHSKVARIESGLVISAADHQCSISAGVMPYTLALSGALDVGPADFDPEYDMSHYTRERWLEDGV